MTSRPVTESGSTAAPNPTSSTILSGATQAIDTFLGCKYYGGVPVGNLAALESQTSGKPSTIAIRASSVITLSTDI